MIELFFSFTVTFSVFLSNLLIVNQFVVINIDNQKITTEQSIPFPFALFIHFPNVALARVAYTHSLTHSLTQHLSFMNCSGSLTELKELISTDKTLLFQKDAHGATPLHHSAFTGQLEVVKWLIKKGNQKNNKKKRERNRKKRKGKLIMLLFAGVAVDAQDNDLCSPLHNAAFTGRLAVVKVLLENGSKIENCHISFFHSISFISFFSGASVNLADIDGATPLQKTVFSGK
jgi:ankyrin repeat protein